MKGEEARVYTCPQCRGHRVVVRRRMFGRVGWRWCPDCHSKGTVTMTLFPDLAPLPSSYLELDFLSPEGHRECEERPAVPGSMP